MNTLRILLFSAKYIYKSSPLQSLLLLSIVLLQGLMPAVMLYIVSQIIIYLTRNNSIQFFQSDILYWAGAVTISSLITPLVSFLQGNLTEKLTFEFNKAVIEKADSYLGLEAFENEDFYNKIMVIKEQSSFQPLNLIIYTANFVKYFGSIVGLVSVLSVITPLVPVIILISSIPLAIVTVKLQKSAWEMMMSNSPEVRKMNYLSQISISTDVVKEIKTYSFGKYITDMYSRLFGSVHKKMYHTRLSQTRWATFWLIPTVAGSLLGLYITLNTSIDANRSANIFLIVSSLSIMQQTLQQLFQDIGLFSETIMYMRNFHEFIESNDGQDRNGNVNLDQIEGIEFIGVTFIYPDGRKAINDLSFKVCKGDRLAIVGHNGAGKTTIIKLLLRLYDPTHGQILINGRSLTEYDVISLREKISVIFQDFGKYDMTVSENIQFGKAQELNLDRFANYINMQFLDTLPQGENTSLGKQFGGTELSGGQWQKIALARAANRISQADLLILDEPTSALDPESELEVFSSFAEITRGKTAIFITHRLGSVKLSTRILVIKNGSLVEEGTHSELLRSNGEYKGLWDSQADQYQIG